MEIMPPVGYTIAVYSILVIVGAYAVIHGFISSLHIPAKDFLSSKEFRYGLVALISFLVSIPFLIPLDLTLIPQGFLDAHYAFFPYHALLLLGGFFLVNTIKKGLWLEDIPAIPETGEAAIPARDIIKEYGLTTREAQIYLLLLEHKAYKDIADTLGISVPTAKTHILNLYRKLNINKKSELPGLQTPRIPGSKDSC